MQTLLFNYLPISKTLWFSLLLLVCNLHVTYAQETKVFGKIKGAKQIELYQLSSYYQDGPVMVKWQNTIGAADLDETGAFEMKVSLDEHLGYVYMKVDENLFGIYLQKGEPLEIGGNASFPTFKGKTAPVIQYLLEAQNLKDYYQKSMGYPEEIDMDLFEAKGTMLQKEVRELFQKHAFDEKKHAGFIKAEKLNIQLIPLDFSLHFGFYPLAFEGSQQSVQKTLGDFPYHDPMALHSNLWLKLASSLVMLNELHYTQYNPELSEDANVLRAFANTEAFIEKNFREPAVKAILLENPMVLFLNQYKDTIPSEIREKFAFHITNTLTGERRENTGNIYRKRLNTNSSGTKAAMFKGHNFEGKELSLDSFKGKTIYMDVWATWCAPCVRAIPAWGSLQKEFENKNDIVFLAISIDKETDKWRAFLKQHPEFTGIHINLSKEEFQSFASNYFIGYYPTYLLIDKEGNVANYGSPSPESQEIRGFLRK